MKNHKLFDFRVPASYPKKRLKQLRPFTVKGEKIKPVKIHYRMRLKVGKVVTVSPNTIDLGKVKDPVQATIMMTNDIDKPVYIVGFSRSCGCTSSDYPKIINVGETIEVKLLIVVTKPGDYTKQATFTFEADGKRQQETFTVKFTKLT